MSEELPEGLSQQQRRRGQAALTRVAVSFTLANSFTWSISALFLLGLGATPFHLGLLETTTHLDRTARLGGIKLMERLGKASLLFWGRIAAVLPTAALVALAFSGKSDPALIWAALAMMGLISLIKQVGNTGWWPLIQDNTAGDALGSVLSRMRMRQRSLDLVLPLIVGWYLGAQPSTRHFALPFAMGLLATGAAAWLMRGIAERPLPKPETGFWQRILAAGRRPSLRRYGLYAMVHSLLSAASMPFWVVVLTGRGMGAMYFVWMTSVAALGNLGGLLWWGRLVDAHGSRPVLTITLLAQALLGLAWLGLPSQPLWLLAWATPVYLMWGMLQGGIQMGENRAMVDAVSSTHQGEGFTLAIYASALGGGLGGLLGGFAFQWVNQLPPTAAGWEPTLLYLAALQLAMAGAWYLSTFLSGYEQQTSLRTLARQWRRRLK